MSFILKPFTYIYDAYESITCSFPLTRNRNKRKYIYHKNDKGYDNILKKLPGSEIKSTMKPFLDIHNIRKDLIFIETSCDSFCAALGNNNFTAGQAVIYSHPKFYELDPHACKWVMKHEVSHIKNNDCFLNPLISAICSLATATLSINYLPLIPTWALTIAIGHIANLTFCQYLEIKADEFAILNSSNEELKGGRRFLIAYAKIENKTRKSFSLNLSDFTHPSTSSRIALIEKTLQARNIKINKKLEKPLIKRMKKLMADWFTQL